MYLLEKWTDLHFIITQNTKILLLKVVPQTGNEVLLQSTTAVILSSASQTRVNSHTE